MGKYTVGLPRPGPVGREIVNRWANVVRQHGAEMANNYLQGITAVANSPAMLNNMAAKLDAWYAAFFGAGVPAAYRRAITAAKEQYYRARVGARPVAAQAVAPPPA